MDRKISGKTHRSIKNKQRFKRLAKLESCTNIAPRNADEQAVPKSLERIIKLKETMKTNTGILKRKKKKNTLICVGLQHHRPNHSKAKLEKVIPIFQQQPGESGKQFMHRVSRDTYDFLKEVAFEKKYDTQIEQNSNTDGILYLNKYRHEKNVTKTLGIKHKNINRKKIIESSATLSKNKKRRLKLHAKKRKKQESHDEFEKLQDKIIFGEIAYEPPRLKMKSKKINKVRKSKNLLLNLILEDSKEDFSASKVINRSGKKKYLKQKKKLKE